MTKEAVIFRVVGGHDSHSGRFGTLDLREHELAGGGLIHNVFYDLDHPGALQDALQDMYDWAEKYGYDIVEEHLQ